MNQYYKRREANKLNDRELWRVKNIDEDNIMCSKCLKCYKPTKDDVGIRNPNYYFKTCYECRSYYNNYKKVIGFDYKKYQKGLLYEKST